MPDPRVTSAAAVDGVTVDVLFDQPMLTDSTFYDPTNYTVTGHTVAAVSSPATNTARLTVSEMFTGESMSLEVDPSLQSALGDSMDINFLEASFTGVGTQPTVLSASTPNETTIRITFSEGMTLDAELIDPNNYTLVVMSGGAANSIANVSPEAVANPTYVNLLLVSEMTDGIDYVVTVATTVSDAVGNLLDGSAAEATVTGLGTPPELSTAVVREDGRIRLTFSEPMRRNVALGAISNYVFVPQGSAAPLYGSEVLVPASPANPTYVDIVVSEMTDGENYEVTALNVVDVAGNLIDPANDTVTFAGVGTPPTVESVIARSINRVDVVFSERMRETADIIDPTNYTFDNGLTVIDVLGFVDNTVQLVTSDQTPGILYTLTINS